MSAGVLIVAYLFVVLLPLGLAWAQDLPSRSIWDELASGAGLLALVVMLVEFLFSGRFQTISRRIGMDVTMRFHQLFARSALALALVHPFLYRAEQNPQYAFDPSRQMTLNYDPIGLIPGIIAWVGLAALILVALDRSGVDHKYERWRLAHGLGAALVAVMGVWHAVFLGRYSADPAMTWVWVVLLAIALLSLVYVYFVSPLFQHPWKVASVENVARRTWELELAPDGHDGLRYEAGQFVWLNLGHSAFSLHENPFSLSSSSAAGKNLSFIIKELGDFTNQVGSIAVGTRAYVDGPHGNLHLAGKSDAGVALIAGGVGIAPMMSILRDLTAKGDARPKTLLYGNREAAQIVCREELEAMERNHDVRVVHFLTAPPPNWTGGTGYIDKDVLKAEFGTPGHRDWIYVLCGPPAMLESVEDGLIELGVPAQNILLEQFSYD